MTTIWFRHPDHAQYLKVDIEVGRDKPNWDLARAVWDKLAAQFEMVSTRP